MNNIIFDTYFREINRYGGDKLIDKVEVFFDKDSRFVIALLSNYNAGDDKTLEKLYFIGIISILKEMVNDLNEMFVTLDSVGNQKFFRKLYQKDRKEYRTLFESSLNEGFLDESNFKNIKTDYFERKQTLIDLKTLYDKTVYNKEVTNTTTHFLLSLTHMYCNRLRGDNSNEEKFSVLIRHALFDRLAYLKNKGNMGVKTNVI